MLKKIHLFRVKAFLTLGVISLVFFYFLLSKGEVKAENPVQSSELSLISAQHRDDACILGALATHLNFVSGGRNYTSAGLALAYKLKYHAENWAQDGNTSHNAQMLAADAGFKVEIGQMGKWGGVAALKYLAWAKRYPIVFLNGNVQHAVTVLALVDENTLLVADPWTGTTFQDQLEIFYNKLEPMKWYFTSNI